MKLGCIVLAAGRSIRFGENKLLKPLRGETVLKRTLKAVPQECFERCAVVCAQESVKACALASGFEAVFYTGGALSDSIRQGLKAMPDMEGWLFINGDQPLLKRESVMRMIGTFTTHPEAVCRLSCGDVQASPVLLPSSLKDALMSLDGEKGGMCAVRCSGLKVIPVQASSECELWDVDDEAMFRQVEACLV